MPRFEILPEEEAPPPRRREEPRPEPEIRPAAPTFAPPVTPIRAMPHNLQAEEQLLGCCLIDFGDTLDRAARAGIRPDSFYAPANGMVFGTLLEMRKAGKPVSTDVLAAELVAARRIEEAGGFPGLMRISSSIGTSVEADYFIAMIRSLAGRRRVIRIATQTLEGAYEGRELPEILTEASTLIREASIETGGSLLPARGAMEFALLPEGDVSILLGDGYLNRGDGGLLISSSGMGKSALAFDMACTWALGRDFHGMPPNGHLRSLIIQSEDADGDIAQVKEGFLHGMKLSDEDRALVNDRVRIVTDRVHAGESFFLELAAQIAAFKPDLVWLNPLQAFIDGDIKDSRDLGNFLRRGLNRLNEPASFGFIGVHHTNKPPQAKDKAAERTWSEGMYDMAGGAELINWARFIINLRPGPEAGQFNMVLSKRGNRAGVIKRVEQGAGFREEVVTTIHLKWSDDMIEVPGRSKRLRAVFWESRTPSADEGAKKTGAGRPIIHTFEKYADIFPTDRDKATIKGGINQLFKAADEIRPIGRATFFRMVEQAVEDGKLLTFKVDTRPKYYRATGI